MVLTLTDWAIIVIFLVILTIIGLITSKTGSKDSTNYFVSGKNMPWWLLGVSMVATTFSLGTPNLITDMVRTGGVAQNWLWWCFLFSGMLTVFVYAKLWNRSNILTDLEFYEIRYSGKEAAVLRGFRAIYLGFFFNVLILASASLAYLKFSAIMFDVNPVLSLIAVSSIVLLYSTIGGLTSILWTDFYLFVFAMLGAILPPIFIIKSPDIGGLSSLLNHPLIVDKLSILPDFDNWQMVLTIFIIPVTIQWWASWYPGSEPGGGGYITQRILSAKNEKHAVGATLFFNLMHFAIRPWPWILVALCSIVIFPDVASMVEHFQDVPEKYIRNDFAYPALIREYLPTGIIGLVLASLIAAYLSTISTQLNWGASYLVNDFYARFIDQDSSEKRKVFIGRLSTILLLVFSIILAILLENALQIFQYMLMIGAGTGLIYLIRWFWWRINAWSEISAMIGAVVFSLVVIIIERIYLIRIDQNKVDLFGFAMTPSFWDAIKFTFIVTINTIFWIIVTFLTKPTHESRLISFYEQVQPTGSGWTKIAQKSKIPNNQADKREDIPIGLLCMSLSCVSIFSALFSIGYLIYGNYLYCIVLLSLAVISGIIIFRFWNRLFD